MASSRQLQISITSSHFKKDSISQTKLHNLGKALICTTIHKLLHFKWLIESQVEKF